MSLNPGWVGGLIGALGGLAGGIFGTYRSIQSAGGPRERRFMIGAAVVMWLGIGTFVVLLWTLPPSRKVWLWIPYGVLLLIGIVTVNRKLARIRREEAQGPRA
jgi:hypothetical protein